jgi:hypothetical protein
MILSNQGCSRCGSRWPNTSCHVCTDVPDEDCDHDEADQDEPQPQQDSPNETLIGSSAKLIAFALTVYIATKL